MSALDEPNTDAESISQTLGAVIPVYENASALGPLFERLGAVSHTLRDCGFELEIVFVDDGSTDGSFERLTDLSVSAPFRTKIVRLSRNFGGVSAIKAGLADAAGEAVAILAADLQDPPENLVLMAMEWRRGSKLVVCERTSRAREDGFVPRTTSALHHLIVRKVILDQYPKGGFDMMLLDSTLLPYLRDSAKAMYPQILVSWLGIEPKVIPYERPKRTHGTSTWSFGKRLAAFGNIVFGYSSAPIQVITVLGVLLAVMSFCFAVSVVLARLLGANLPPGYAALAVLIAMLSGIILMTLGILGQYVWRIYDQLSGRPDYVVSETFEPGRRETTREQS